MKLYRKYFAIHLKSAMQYKASFFLALLGQALVTINMFLGIFFLFQRFHVIEGFTYSQVLLCYTVVLLQFYVAEFFARGFDRFDVMLGNGQFDRILVRPRNTVFQVLAGRIEFTRLGRVLQVAILLPYAIATCGVDWNFPKALTVIFMVLGGALLFSAIFVLCAALSFFTTEGLEVINVFTDGGKEHGKYPWSVYGKRVLQFTTFAVPYALTQYYPLLYLLGRETNSFFIFLPLCAAWFLLPCYLIWRIGVRHYKSTGS
ncbi:ABC transporter permease [Neglectibacter caecimuris]|uniref:ABC transporter permease n=1 Tax=Neglectibacter caecimuris TaxID=3093658 RepID=UPI002AC8E435|nr:ABC-2 family transporter protein [Neglectibacter sp. M00184]